MNCPRCGTPVAPGTAFCANCGLPVAQMHGASLQPPKKSPVAVILIVLAVVFGGGLFLVAILAAILFPVFAKAREAARYSTCETNVKQIELGMMQYAQDHNDNLPPSAAGYKSTLMPYVMSEQTFQCPDNASGGVAYSLNTNLQGKNLDKMKHPEAIVAVYEGHNQTLDFRHDGRAVVGFVDGHVKIFTPEQAQSLQWKP